MVLWSLWFYGLLAGDVGAEVGVFLGPATGASAEVLSLIKVGMTLVQRPKSPEEKHESEFLEKLQVPLAPVAWDRKLIALGFIFSLLAGHFLALLKLLNESLEGGWLWIQGFFGLGLGLTFLGGIWALIGWFQTLHKNFKIVRY